MTTPTRLEDLHLHRLQLFAYCSIGQTLLQKTLIKQTFECGLSTNCDPYIMLSEILEKKKDQLKKLNNIFVNTSSKELIYKDYDRDELNPSINIFKLDTSSLVELLNGIDAFETSPKHTHPGIQCNDQNHQQFCCVECSPNDKGKDFHKCKKCNKIKCTGNRCCETNSKKCNHDCLKCGTKEFFCKKNNKVCCAKCKLCLNCFLKSQNQPTEIELVRSRDWSKGCSIRKIKISINLMSTIRNLTMHLTNEQCVDLDASKFQSDDLPGINNWNDLNTVITNVLNKLINNVGYRYISTVDSIKIQKSTKDIGNMTDKEELLRIYEEKIRTFGTFEHLLEIKENLQQLNESFQQLQLKNLAFHVQFLFHENVNYNMDCDLASDIRNHMESWIKILFNGCYQLIDNGLVSTETSNTKNIRVEFQIEATSPESNDLHVYKKGDSTESKELWKNISDCLKDQIPNLENVERVFWELGSIIIGVVLYKKQGAHWTKEEFEMTRKCLPNICSELNKTFAGCFVFSCEVIPIEENDNQLKTLSFEIVSDGEVGEDMMKNEALTECLTYSEYFFCFVPHYYSSKRKLLQFRVTI